MKTLITICFLVIAQLLSAQQLKLKGLIYENATKNPIVAPTIEVFKNGVYVETVICKKNKLKYKTKADAPLIFRISKSGYDDIFFGIDYSTAKASDKFNMDVPLNMYPTGTGKGLENMTYQWNYEINQETPLVLDVTTTGEIKAKLKL